MNKILVGIKRVIDFNTRIRVKADGSGVETQSVRMSVNPFDEIALEEAIQLKERQAAKEVIALSIGPQESQEVLRTALAFGADRAILIRTALSLDPIEIARCLKFIIEQEAIDLVLLGKQAIDDDSAQVGPMVAGLLNWPQATFASAIKPVSSHIEVQREVDGGLEWLRLSLPAVVTADLRLNQPRYISLPNIMRAKQKPITVLELDSLPIALGSEIRVQEVRPPHSKKPGILVKNIRELVDRLKTETKIIL